MSNRGWFTRSRFAYHYGHISLHLTKKNNLMTLYAKGEFEVKLVPQTDERDIPLLGRLTIDKVFHGDIAGTSQGQMLSAKTAVPASAGYVAIERVEATVNGRQGSFVLQH